MPSWSGRWVLQQVHHPRSEGIYAFMTPSTRHIRRWIEAQWARQTSADWIVAIDRMSVGDYVQRDRVVAGRPIAAGPAGAVRKDLAIDADTLSTMVRVC